MSVNSYAFPIPECEVHGNRHVPTNKGMTLRDYFAAQLMAGDAANSANDDSWRSDAPDDALLKRAEFYYRFADAMLKARG
ncbi:hypothetical protein PPN31114_00235 [Pandoraea pneumonica]|uniref:Gp38 n=1 Tax=Pandoraea pneumonica TaxID=2508299 RepID=A0A5E4RML8_9BURK|nr:hypothetical protein [Pandoraea pneumonica]VVD63682.1 hypothetical protein PPN31114_00235 [Pandoraea pneumonica]